ncbi:MAG TPA: LysM peptidoglycan-binding domain-containing protein [Candidatus Saccharimonadia bacterium]|nr:LysM peptidoglycan-binding domain-containing protein [Candidatus Saccharimonadia bacterium]
MGQIAPGVGDTSEPFSNIKTPAAPKTRRAASKFEITTAIAKNSLAAAHLLRQGYRPRYLAHLGFLGAAAFLVIGNSPDRAHSVSVRLMSAQAGASSTLDAAATASMAADIAAKSQLMVAEDATKTATTKSQQVALLTADDNALAKRQVVSTAGNATRDIITYAVQPGDTLSDVAGKFGITSATIKWANNLDDADMIKPGQVLTILPVSGLEYTVQAGDTPDSIAAAYSANAAQILSFNNAEVKGLAAGLKIIVPDGVKQEAPKAAPAVTNKYSRVAGAATVSPTLTRFAFSGNGYSVGYCTYYVASRRAVPSNWGNAVSWYYNAQASGFGVGSTPVPGAIAWSGAGYYGHVAYVESVSGGMVTVSEMNYNGGWNRVSTRTVSAGTFRYIF